MWSSDNRNDHDYSNGTVPLSIDPHLPGAVQILQGISLKPFIKPIDWYEEQVLFTIMGDISLGFWSRKTRNYTCHRHNNRGKISEEVLEVYSGD